MKKIVLAVLFLLYGGFTSQAQVQKDDLLISHSHYQKLQAELSATKKELAHYKTLASKIDSLKAANQLVLEQNERIILASLQRHSQQENKIRKLQEQNSQLKNQLEEQKARTNHYRYVYQASGRFRDKAQVATLWASLISVGFIMSMNEQNPQASYWMAGGSAALTLGLAFNLSRLTKE